MIGVSVTKEFRWEAAHRLMGFEGEIYPGKCRHNHGHSYRAEITVERPNLLDDESAPTPKNRLDKFGFVMDFDLLGSLKEWIDEHWDHSTLVHPNDVDLRNFLKAQDNKMFVMPEGFSTSAESLCMFLLQKSSGLLKESDYEEPFRVCKVKIWETAKCSAEVTA